MTDPTADAAKLRDDLTKLLAHIEDGPYIGAVGVADAVLNWAAENIADLSRELARGTLQNSRPQPAPPEGEPNFAREADMLLPDDFPSSTDPNAPYTRGYRRQNLADEIAAELRRAYRLGLAARPKIKDALPDFKAIAAIAWSSPEGCAVLEEELRAVYYRGRSDQEAISVRVTPFSDLHRAEAAEAKLAEREAELAQMQRERDGERETRERASDALMAKDEAIGVLIEIAGPQACQRAMDILDERRAIRQQQKASGGAGK